MRHFPRISGREVARLDSESPLGRHRVWNKIDPVRYSVNKTSNLQYEEIFVLKKDHLQCSKYFT